MGCMLAGMAEQLQLRKDGIEQTISLLSNHVVERSRRPLTVGRRRDATIEQIYGEALAKTRGLPAYS